jgi:hypothetical protein
MCIYVQKNYYVFKDFSSGKGGTAENLVMCLYGLSYGEAVAKIISDYTKYISSGKVTTDLESFKKMAKYGITSYTKRSWNVYDAKYWQQYNINSKILDL